jgi:DNA-binding XRE family transcriptional regulator
MPQIAPDCHELRIDDYEFNTKWRIVYFIDDKVKDMDAQTRARLEAAGFVETNVQELFGLTPEENELVETRVALSRLIKCLRQENHLSQAAIAKHIGSDQSRVAKAEKNDPSASIELMLRVAFALGEKRQQIGQALQS